MASLIINPRTDKPFEEQDLSIFDVVYAEEVSLKGKNRFRIIFKCKCGSRNNRHVREAQLSEDGRSAKFKCHACGKVLNVVKAAAHRVIRPQMIEAI
jgi:predicted SprT family Zn-dependent metalloprotease